MHSEHPWRSLTSVFLVFFLLCLALPTSPAVAGWMATRPAVDGPKAHLVSALDRAEISQALEELGVDPSEAKRRVAGLTDAEAQLALDRLDTLPAGGSTAGAIIGAVVFVFVVLLITDLLGFTDVFPFVKKTVR